MNYKIVITATALLLSGTSVFAQDAQCPAGTMTCNIATVGDKEYNADQTIGDTVNPTYSPDSSSSSSSASNDIDNVIQGDTLTNNANANGNMSENNNQSSANNSAENNMTNGNISNDVSGGNISSTGGNITGGSLTQNGSADIVNNGQSNTQGGNANTNSGDISNNNSATGGEGGSASSGAYANTGPSTSNATGGQSYSNSQGGNSSSGVSGSGNSRNSNNNRTGNQTVNANSTYNNKEAARSAIAPNIVNNNGANCYGDTNPSGGFSAAIQTFGWGASAGRSKQSNVCAATQLGQAMEKGQGNLGVAYLSQQDPMFHVAGRTINPATGQPYTVTKQQQLEAETHKARANAAAKIYQPKLDNAALYNAKGELVGTCQVTERNWNGTPKHIVARPVQGISPDAITADCIAYHEGRIGTPDMNLANYANKRGGY